jgi:hypothetical protein
MGLFFVMLGRPFFPMVHRYSKRPRYFRIGLLPGLRIPDIENRDVLARIQSSA